jgi:hypothetical protein
MLSMVLMIMNCYFYQQKLDNASDNGSLPVLIFYPSIINETCVTNPESNFVTGLHESYFHKVSLIVKPTNGFTLIKQPISVWHLLCA